MFAKLNTVQADRGSATRALAAYRQASESLGEVERQARQAFLRNPSDHAAAESWHQSREIAERVSRVRNGLEGLFPGLEGERQGWLQKQQQRGTHETRR